MCVCVCVRVRVRVLTPTGLQALESWALCLAQCRILGRREASGGWDKAGVQRGLKRSRLQKKASI